MMSTDLHSYVDRLCLLYEDDNCKLFEYVPTLSNPLLCHFEPMRLVRRMRFALEFFGKGKYRVYYLAVNDSLVGHCVIAPGGRRLKCSTPNDIVVGPYFIEESMRGKGYSKRLLQLTLEHCSYSYQYAYDWIEKENLASIRTSEACGFQQVGELNVVGVLRKLQIVPIGDDWIYRYEKEL